MRRTWIVIIATLVVVAFAVAIAGCGSSSTAGKGATQKKAASSTAKASNSSSQPSTAGAQTQQGGGQVKTLADFPDGQDGANVQAVIKTDKGDIVLQFYPDVAPVTVASFLHLARTGFYNGTTFHRVEPDFVVQGGDPKSKDPNAQDVGTGGPGYNVPAEFNAKPHLRGTLSMARSSDANSGGSQFFICLSDQPNLNGQYTVFGQVVSGMDVVDKIVQGDVMRQVIVEPKSG